MGREVNVTIQPGESVVVTIVISWLSADNVKQPELTNGSATTEYNVTLGFSQAE